MADLPKGLRVRGKSKLIEINLYYKGERLFVRTGLPATKENLKHASILRETMINAIKHDKLNGTEHFNITDYLPESGKINQLLGRNTINKNITFEEYSELYRNRITERIESGELKYSSLKSYKVALNKLKAAKFFNMKMRDIKKSHIEDYKTQLLKMLSPKSVNNLLTPMRQIFEMAFEDEVIDSNPADRVKNPKFPRPEINPFTSMEVEKILMYMSEKHPEHVGYVAFMFYTGCRVGEALAAKWENLTSHGENWTYFFKESRTEGRIGTPKTRESIREVPIMQPLKRYLTQQKKISFMAGDFIFINPRTGEPYYKNAHIINGIWKPALKKLKIAYRDMREFRHTHAVLSLVAGDNIHDIAKRLGHSDTGVTIRTYAKYLKDYSKPSNLEQLLNIETNCKSSNSI